MRIVLACPYSWHACGGVQAHVAQLAQVFRQRGHEVWIVAPGEADAAPEPGVSIVGAPIRIPYNGSVAPSCMEPASLGRVRRLLSAVRPDVVHAHEPFSSFVSGAAVLHAGAPVVATFHAAVDRRRDRALYAAVTRSLWWLNGRIDTHVAVSDAAASTVRLATSRPVTIVPNGVELHRFAPLAAAPLPRADTVLVVGRLEARKGLGPLLDAVTRLAAHRPGLRLVVVGDGPERSALDRLPAHLQRVVERVAPCDRDELVRCYARAAVFVAPSTGRESFGMALLDALAAGRPAVASDIPAFRWLLDGGRAGLLARAGDGGDLARQIARLLDDRALATRLGRAAVLRSREFSWEGVADRLEMVYDAAIATASLSAPPRPAADEAGQPCDAR